MSGQTFDALALVEVSSIATGYRVLNELIKRAPVHILDANLTEPSKFVIVFWGPLAAVEEAMEAALETAGSKLLFRLLIPYAHRNLITALAGSMFTEEFYDTIGVVDCESLSATLIACDRALKDAHVSLVGLRLVNGLGGRGFFVVHGAQHDVEAAVGAAAAAVEEGSGPLGRVVQSAVVTQVQAEMVPWVMKTGVLAVGGH